MSKPFKRFGTPPRPTTRTAKRLADDALKKNQQYFRALAAVCIEHGGSLTIDFSTLNLLDPEDELSFENDIANRLCRITYIPYEHPEDKDDNHRLAGDSQAAGVRDPSPDVEGSVRDEVPVDSRPVEPVQCREEHNPGAAGEGRSPDEGEGRPQLPESPDVSGTD